MHAPSASGRSTLGHGAAPSRGEAQRGQKPPRAGRFPRSPLVALRCFRILVDDGQDDGFRPSAWASSPPRVAGMLVVAPWLAVRPALKPGSEKWRSVLPRDQKVSFAAGGSFMQKKTQRNRVRQAAHAPVSWAQGESFSPSRSISEEGAFVNVCAFIPRGLTRPPLCRAVVLMEMHAPRASSVGVGGVVAGPGVGPPVGRLLAARCLDRSTRSQPTFTVRHDDAPATRVPAAVPLPAPSLSSLRLSARRVPHSSDAPALWLPRLRVCVLAVTSLFLVLGFSLHPHSGSRERP